MLAAAFEDNLNALSASAPAAPTGIEEAAMAAPVEDPASAAPLVVSTSVTAPGLSTSTDDRAAEIEEDLSHLGAAAAPPVIQMEIFSREEMASMPTVLESAAETTETRRVRFFDPNENAKNDQEEMDEDEYENRISRTPNKVYPPRDMKGKRPRFEYPEEGVRISTLDDPTAPIEPVPVPPMPEARKPAAVIGKLKRDKKRDLINRKTLKVKREGKKKVERMSLKLINQEMQKIRVELNQREVELRERKQAQVILKIRKERIERLESSHSPLHNLYDSKISDSEKRCILCGQTPEIVEMFDAATQIDPFFNRRRGAVPTTNPFGFGILTSEQKDENERRHLRMVELNATHERVRKQEREKRGSPKIRTGFLVDPSASPPPPKPRLGEEHKSDENEVLIDLTGTWDDPNKGPLED